MKSGFFDAMVTTRFGVLGEAYIFDGGAPPPNPENDEPVGSFSETNRADGSVALFGSGTWAS